MRFLLAVLWLLVLSPAALANVLLEKIQPFCIECPAKSVDSMGLSILEYGEEALISRAWLARNASHTIDVQYFIWSTDNIGILASEALLGAAERGVKVRVIVDDFLMDADDNVLLALAAHPNVSIKIYNPTSKVGTSAIKRTLNVATNFRGVNQRMHDKTAIFDGVVGITGGRNMADEYFDFDHDYNFRDRDALLVGNAVHAMTENFEEFWASDLAVPVETLLAASAKRLTEKDIKGIYLSLHAYAENPQNFEPEIRQMLDGYAAHLPVIFESLVWSDAVFVSDIPGKNKNRFFLSGGGQTTATLAATLAAAQHSVLIQSPYLVFPDEAFPLLENLHKRGVKVRVSTNSLASTDNLMAFSGYQNQRQALLRAGVEIYEFMPHPAIQAELVQRYPLQDGNPVFALHAKSMVVDNQIVFIGTFNLDPRSTNLNTEVGVMTANPVLADRLTRSIERDIHPDNSWRTTEHFNPDYQVPLAKRMRSGLFRVLPMKRVL